ncbi:MAG TPA: DUF3152 domain-containing protein [Actinoplanes sp.]|nr:DUF3152 domain-containing protein [Actinoplanes sp.]
MTASTDQPPRKPARRPAAKKSTTPEQLEKPKPAAVKSTSARATTTGRAPARKTATPRTATPKAEERRRPIARPVPAEPEPELAAPPSLTRGILELAAERLAATPPPEPEPEVEAPARTVGVRRATAAKPPVEIRPETSYPQTPNRRGLPASLRLPAELPDNLWPPKSVLERNLAENIRVEAKPEPLGRHHAPELDPVTEERIYVPAAPEAEEFLPAVLARPEVPEEPEEPEYVPAHSRPSPARNMVPESTTARRLRRRRRAVLVAYVIVVLLLLIVGHELWNDEEPIAPGREMAQPTGQIGVAEGPTPAVTTAAPEAVKEEKTEPKGKSGDFSYERSRGPMLGEAGRLYRFRVAVEETVDGTSPEEFASVIDETLGDDRSWVHSGELRLRRVPKAGDDVDFTIYLASAKTSEKMCATGGLDTEGYTSCRVPGKVIINAERWANAVPEYGDRLTTYRRYTINHEVGHELGHGHEACPGKGEPAPVMQQQTFGLKGCTANAWPYLDGDRYQGEPIA